MLEVSPHTRGWTFWMTRTTQKMMGFPAHAGMDPTWWGTSGRGGWFPRTRGDGPLTTVKPTN